MQEITKKLTGKEAMNFVKMIEQPFKSVPHLPKGLMEFLVGIAPWVVGLFGVLNIFSSIDTFRRAMDPNPYGDFFASFVNVDPTFYWLAGVVSLLSGVLFLMAFSPLQARKSEGWVYLFWANMLTIVQAVGAVILASASIVGSLVSVLIGLYVLFEFKPYYSAGKAKKSKRSKKK